MTAYHATVLRTAHVTPRMLRVTLVGDELKSYQGSGLPDESCRVVFPGDGEPRRVYTIRRRDAETGQIDLDFVLHDGGVAAEWARAAQPGDPVLLSGSPAGKYAPPPDTEWQLLAGDATALPALGRIAENLAPGARAHALCVIEDDADRQPLPGVTVDWITADPSQAGPRLTAAVLAHDLPPGPGYLWVAGEMSATRDVRKHLRHALGLPADRYSVVGYWRHNAEEWEARFRAVEPDLAPRLAAAEDIPDDEEYFDVVDDIHAEAGL
ncbi:siderophore-interacting protein [Actinokineospora pegani]|uniref:siderophore-interacting protein n=1 Tax=Actinokineospora pegani TaxID=2654637 RepID=UPI0012EAF5E1|nr:siderophore-interacting protein [Actinokineospora pegani]